MKEPSEIILRVLNVSKRYAAPDGNYHAALTDVSFDLKKGEIVGIIGKNGAGKSTLLKILSQITSPTEGHIEYEGILTSILEIGTGFHPELTGRENVFLGGSLLGMSKAEMNEVYSDIVAFSEMEEFMDRPVKHFSSGMYLRLAFSVAFHAKVDILLLDEVLAVGDVDFRRKCYDHIRELKRRGVSIVFVSHSMDPIVTFSDRCILLEKGSVKAIGDPFWTVEQYMNPFDNPSFLPDEKSVKYLLDCTTLKLPNMEILDFEIVSEGKNDRGFTMSDSVLLRLRFNKFSDENSVEIAYVLDNMNDVRVLIDSYGFRQEYTANDLPSGSYLVECTIPRNLLNRGVYRLGMYIAQNDRFVKEIENIAVFSIRPTDTQKHELKTAAAIRPHLAWNIERFSE